METRSTLHPMVDPTMVELFTRKLLLEVPENREDTVRLDRLSVVATMLDPMMVELFTRKLLLELALTTEDAVMVEPKRVEVVTR